jgi:protein phosphatase
MEKWAQKTADAASASGEAELLVGAICDRGLNPRRPVNQDRYLAMPEKGVFAVFDGVGGRKAGEVASQTAADTVEEAFAAGSSAASAELIRHAIQIANRDVYELGQTEPAYGSMATTIALLYVVGNRATIAHVGDSRVYRLSSGNLLRETIDHTDLDDQIRAGLISVKQAKLREDNHSINRALGVETEVEFELKAVDLRSADRFLLCTDGVYRHLEDDELAQILRNMRNPQAAADEIKRLVLERGADDNLTAVVVEIGDPGSSEHGRAASEIAARKSADGVGRVPTSADGSRRIRTMTAGSERRSRSGAGDRIHVQFRPDTRASYSSSDEIDDEENRALDEPAKLRRSNALIYSLLLLVLVLAAFYGGLRSSNLFDKKRSSSRPADSQLDQARHAYERGDFRDADQTLSALVASDPQNAQAWYWLGRTQLGERRFAESARNLERAIEISPDLIDAYLQAAAAFEAMGNRARAVEMLSRYGEASRKHAEPGR